MNKLRVYKVGPRHGKDIIAECFIETCAALIKLHFLDSVNRYGKDNVKLDKGHGFTVLSRDKSHLFSLYMEPI